jgi:hypothetical protein
MTTSEPPPNGGETAHLLTLWPEDSPASPSATRAKGGRRTILGGSGPVWPLSFARYDPVTCLWRTSQDCLLPDLVMSSVTWPLSGSMRNGVCSPRAPWVRHIHESACSLWPTPDTGTSPNGHGVRGGKRENGHQSGESLEARIGGHANPLWAEWLMGFPAGWTDVGD